ncbi:Conserved protein [hydrothermal vent metagenome]|uniref:Conserved protein n=1 Tax=hydrothermal vent metagenome TaxID=652676 RepID=A0A1W1CXJ9_9ZZZZ
MKKDNILHTKSYKFAIRVVKLSQYLVDEKKEYILSKQILRSGTSVGALVSESKFAQYWINLLHDTKYITIDMHKSLYADIDELISLLVSITKTIKNKGI